MVVGVKLVDVGGNVSGVVEVVEFGFVDEVSGIVVTGMILVTGDSVEVVVSGCVELVVTIVVDVVSHGSVVVVVLGGCGL